MQDAHTGREKLSTEVVERNGLPLVRASGEIDLYSLSAFEESLREAVSRGKRAIAVDLSGISYLDSSGLSALIAAHKALAPQGAKLYVVAPPEHHAIRRVLEITRVDQIVHVRGSLEEVLAEFRVPRVA